MFRYCNVVFLSLIYTLLVFQSIIPIIDYQLNKKRIAENLCINKYNVQKSCKGNCYLNKQISKSEESTLPFSTPSNHKTLIQDITLNYFPENIFALQQITTIENLIFYIEKSTSLYNQYIFSILRPPIV